MRVRRIVLAVGVLVGSVSLAGAQPSEPGSGTASPSPSAASDPGLGSTAPAVSLDHKRCTDALNAARSGTFAADVETVANGRLAADAIAKADGGSACLAAIEAEPELRASLAAIARKDASDALLAQTEQEHKDAAAHIAKDQKHVILAYAAMWVVAAGFVVFLWRRQQALTREITMLRRDLDAAEKDAK